VEIIFDILLLEQIVDLFLQFFLLKFVFFAVQAIIDAVSS
jgi:hypothetical protein